MTLPDAYVAPDLASVALITIDTQRDVLDGQPLEIAGTSDALPRIQALTGVFRETGRAIVHVVRLYRADGTNVDLCRRRAVESGRRMLVPGSPGAELVPGLLPSPDLRLDADLLLAGGIQQVGPTESVVYKPRWGAFHQTPLEPHLRRLGVSTLAFAGANFPYCPRSSIYEASERDFRAIVVRDGVSGLYARGEEELVNIGVALMDTAELVRALRAPPGTDRRAS